MNQWLWIFFRRYEEACTPSTKFKLTSYWPWNLRIYSIPCILKSSALLLVLASTLESGGQVTDGFPELLFLLSLSHLKLHFHALHAHVPCILRCSLVLMAAERDLHIFQDFHIFSYYRYQLGFFEKRTPAQKAILSPCNSLHCTRYCWSYWYLNSIVIPHYPTSQLGGVMNSQPCIYGFTFLTQ